VKGYKGGMNMQDRIDLIGHGTVIQQGKRNDRIYLMKLDQEDCPAVLDELRKIAAENKYTKIFCKVPGKAAPYFFSDGYIMEAYIPKFYRGKDPAFFLSKFLDSDRLLGIEVKSLERLGELLNSIQGKKNDRKSPALKYSSVRLGNSDIERITDVFKKVFASYPFPIFNTEYIQRTMQDNVQYFGVETKGKLIAVASAEIDSNGSNAEMTDFATLPEYRGHGLAQILLSTMEKEMKRIGIFTLYTIARLNSFAMNKTFLNHNYHYAGTLIKNTEISGKIESMNVFYKHIRDDS
jgi:putative beta-lysine N-acetyltransferase